MKPLKLTQSVTAGLFSMAVTISVASAQESAAEYQPRGGRAVAPGTGIDPPPGEPRGEIQPGKTNNPTDIEPDEIRSDETKTDVDQSTTDLEATKPMAKPDSQMQAVLDELASLNPKPITSLSAEDARKQPSIANAVKNLADKQNKKLPELGEIDDVEIKLNNVDLDGRVYRPEGDGPFPVILYIHGGGWVLADLDTYDSSARALCKATGALVISTDYRHAPEHKFPTAHNDVYGAYQWAMENAHRWSGNGKKVAVVGESAGGNMAAAVSIMAQSEGKQMPVHQVLIYPVANTVMDTPSYKENKDAKPLGAEAMKWFFDNMLATPNDASDPKIALLQAESLKGLPPTTIITAEIDPLRSEGMALAEKLRKDGVAVTYENYEGVTHEFFGTGLVVDKAQDAVALVARELELSFNNNLPDSNRGDTRAAGFDEQE